MKNILTIIGFAFVVSILLSYNLTDNSRSYSRVANVPLKQSGVIVTRDYKKVCSLIKKGWVVQDVDVSGERYYNDVDIYYTLIKY